MFVVYESITQLPEIWDEVVEGNIFLKLSMLTYLEVVNPCGQRYYLDSDNGIAFVSYKLKLDLFTFSSKLRLQVPVNIIGIPMSVSNCGYHVASEEALTELYRYVKDLKGLYVILNSENELPLPSGNTLPTCKLDIKWHNFEEYLEAMRSNYRYRVNKAMRKFSDIEVKEMKNNSCFDDSLYNLYLEVHENSKEKLERLPIGFFKTFPSKIFQFKLRGEPVAFVQLMEDKEKLIFLFGGFKHSVNLEYDIYINILLFIINQGITGGFKHIDLGQTSEETKLKLGAVLHKKNMFVYHSNPVFNFIIKRFINSFSYKGYKVQHSVFKEE